MKIEKKTAQNSYPPYIKTLEKMRFSVGKSPEGKERLKTGIKTLDTALGGGFTKGSLVAVSGVNSSGKTIIGLQAFFSRDFSENERGLIVTFDETPAQLVSLSGEFKLKNSPHVSVLYLPPLVSSHDMIFEEIRKRITNSGVKHVFLNSVSGLGSVHQEKTKAIVGALLAMFRFYGISALLTYSTDRNIIEPSAMLQNDYIFDMADCVLLLNYIRETNRMRRYISVIKMRASSSNPAPVEFKISIKGIESEIKPSKDKFQDKQANETLNICLNIQDIKITRMLMEEFKKSNLNISLRIVEPGSLANTNILRELRLGRYEFDLVMCGLTDVKKLAADNLLLSLDPYIGNVKNSFFENIIGECEHKYKLYGLPTNIHTFCLLYRKDLFSKYSLDLPADWKDLADKTRYILESEPGLVEGLTYPGDGSSLLYCFVSYLLAGTTKKSGVEIVRDTKIHEEALSFMRDCMYKYGITGKQIFKDKTESWSENFTSGKGILSHCWDFDIRNYERKNPALKGKIGFMSLPKRTEGMNGASLVEGNAYVIPYNSKNPAYAAELLVFLASRGIESNICSMSGFPTLSARKDVCEDIEEHGDLNYFHNAGNRLKDGFLVKDVLKGAEMPEIFKEYIRNTLMNKSKNSMDLEAIEKKIKKLERGKLYNVAISDAIRYMERNQSRKISLSDISGSVRLSPCYFSRLFKERTKQSVFDYLNRLRVEKAKILLRDAYKYNISEVAERSGFSNVHYFSNVFRKYEKCKPSDYRLSART